MKKITLLIFLMIIFLPALGHTQKLKLDMEKLEIGIGMLLPAQMLHTFVHEGSHAFVAKLQGAKVVDFVPWPGKNPKTGKFQFGRTSAKWPGEGYTDAEAVWFFIAPAISDVLIFSATETLFATGAVDTNSLGAAVLFVFGEFAPWVDFTRLFIYSGDLQNIEKHWKRMHGIRWPALLLSCVGAYLMVQRAKQIFFKTEKKKIKKSAFMINTFADKKNMGLSLSYTF